MDGYLRPDWVDMMRGNIDLLSVCDFTSLVVVPDLALRRAPSGVCGRFARAVVFLLWS